MTTRRTLFTPGRRWWQLADIALAIAIAVRDSRDRRARRRPRP
jgi:hypothetical protein